MISEQDIRDQLKRIPYPGSSRDIVTLGLVGEVLTKDGTVIIHLRPSSATEEVLHHLTGRITSAISAVPGVQKVTIHSGRPRGAAPQPAPVAAPALTPLPGVRRVIAVASGKGGVGKSTVAVNLALALKALDNRVGLLDADIYGPSVPLMMGTEAMPRAGQDKKIYPVEKYKYGISLISMGFFLDDKSPVIWRGPIVMSIVRQFLRDVLWDELDYLIVDLPPGTGDAALTLAQEVPLSGGVIVSTPQDVALLDVQRGIAMFRQVNVPILGIIENMSYYVCPHCGEREEIFGHGGVEKTGLEVLGEIPIVEEIRTGGDVGKPLVVQHPEHPMAQVFRQIALRVMEVDMETLQ
ncbi:MAG: Mrp/NBP35 family ATP-binding protein [Deltaproteobacteria bacterium]|nr:Mrp/NBP35 family ATP-binding protein [Deltaproteobacteria bacterium]